MNKIWRFNALDFILYFNFSNILQFPWGQVDMPFFNIIFIIVVIRYLFTVKFDKG